MKILIGLILLFLCACTLEVTSRALQSQTESVSAPTDLAGLVVTEGNAKNDLSWTASTGTGTTKYKILRSTTSGSGFAELATNLTTTTYSDTTAINSVTYYYKVIPFNSVGEGTSSSEVSALTGSCNGDRLTNAPFAWGTGTVGDPYGICTRAQLLNVNTNLTANFKLMTNLDLASEVFIDGIVTDTVSGLSGNFDGNNKIISNFTISSNSGVDSVGFFARATGTISNLRINNMTLTTSFEGFNGVGGLVGYLVGGTVSNSSITNLQFTFECTMAGGLVGQTNGATTVTNSAVINLTMTNTASCNSLKYGGLVGNSTNASSTVSSSYVTGTMTIINGLTTYVGGLSGSATNVTNSYTNVAISATQNAAGLIGNHTQGTVSGNYTLGNTSATGGLGSGLIAVKSGTGTIEKNYSLGNVTATTSAGGIIGSSTSTSVILRNNYAHGNISATTNAGGIVGLVSANGGSVQNSYFAGTVTSGTNRGGIIGNDNNAGALRWSYSNNYYDSTKNPSINSNGTNVSGAPGTASSTAAMTTVPTSIYSTWDFTTIWNQANGSYPTLR